MFVFYRLVDGETFYFTGTFGFDSVDRDDAMFFNPYESNRMIFLKLKENNYIIDWG